MILYNEKQLQCIKHPPGPLMIIAGAGTGKTTTLIGRIAYFINERNIDPSSILILTYTVKAAEHLKESIPKFIDSEASDINASNFHSFALNQITTHFNSLGYSSMPTFIEPSEVKCILRELILDNIAILSSSNYKKDIRIAFENIPKMFDRFRDELFDNDYLAKKKDSLIKDDSSEEEKQLADCINLFFKYQDFKKEKAWIDFGDMIMDLWKLVNNQKILPYIQKSIKHIFVDEYQDNNFALSQIAMRISGEDGSLTVVGDDDQSIYSFRGANVIAFNEFRKYYESFENYAEILLDINYRSTQSILNFANQTVKNNSFRIKSNSLISNKQIDSNVVLHAGSKIAQISKMHLLISKYLQEGVKPNQICILTRSGSNALEVSDYLNKHNIDNSYRTGKLFESNTAKNFISFINVLYNKTYMENGLYRLIINSQYSYLLNHTNSMKLIKEELLSEKIDNNEILKHLKRCRNNLGKDLIELFLDFSKKHLKSSLSDEVIKSISKLINKYNALYSKTLNGDLCDFLNSMFELNEILVDEEQQDVESISVMTIHQSKGMEFEYVFIPFLASQTFPISKGNSANLDNIPNEWLRNSELLNIDKIEEERRVFHVAVTRAKKGLHLLGPIKRRSKFFKEIDSSCFQELELTEVSHEKTKYIFKYKDPVKMPYSATSLSLYEKCPLSFKLDKIDKLSDQVNSPPATFGLFVHRALERIFKEKLDTHEKIQKVILEVWDQDKFDNSYQSNEYMREAITIVWDYVRFNSPNSSIEHYFEEPISINSKGETLYGKIDRIDKMEDGSIRILDYKTSKLKRSTGYLKKDIQLALYSLLVKKSNIQEFNGNTPNVCSLEYIRDYEDSSVEVSFEESDLITLEYRIQKIINSIKDNDFTPQKNANCYFCTYKKLLCPLYK